MAAKHISRPKRFNSFERVPLVCNEQRNKFPVSGLASTRQRTRAGSEVLRLFDYLFRKPHIELFCTPTQRLAAMGLGSQIAGHHAGYRPRVRDKGIRDGDSVPIASRHDGGNGCTNHHYAIQSRFAAADDVVWLRVNRDATTPVTRRLASGSDTRTLSYS